MSIENMLTILIVMSLMYFVSAHLMRLLKYVRSNKIIDTEMPIAVSDAQQDPASVETIKRVRKSFKEQQQAMDARALKAHEISCDDFLTCAKDTCFIQEPDRVVGTEVVTFRLSKDRIQARNELMNKNKRFTKHLEETIDGTCLKSSCAEFDACQCLANFDAEAFNKLMEWESEQREIYQAKQKEIIADKPKSKRRRLIKNIDTV